MKIKYFYLAMFSSICFFILVALVNDASCKQNQEGQKIIVKLDYIPKGDKVILDDLFLSRLLPELKKPRLFSRDDLDDKDEKANFANEGYTFILQGDFNKDGFADIAFIVKDQGEALSKKGIYLVIVSIRGQNVTREYLSSSIKNEDKFFADAFGGIPTRAFIKLEKNYKRKMDTILVVYAIDSDWCELMYWNGKKYIGKMCKNGCIH